MAFSTSQCIHCDVSSCKHHSQDGKCELEAIQVKPRCNCHSGDCDESECGSYKLK